MTINATSNKVKHDGNGINKTFYYDFKIFEATDLEVYIVENDGTEVLQSDYTVTNVGVDGGGNVIFGTVTPAADEEVFIKRIVDITQETDYLPNDPFHAETHEAALDYRCMVEQQLAEVFTRALVVPPSEDGTTLTLPIVEDRALKFIYFDADGNVVAADGLLITDTHTHIVIDNDLTISGSLQVDDEITGSSYLTVAGVITGDASGLDHDLMINTHNLTTDIDHDTLTNTHDLTTDIDHDTITNNHNLTTDIDHDQLTNYAANEHFLWATVSATIDHNTLVNYAVGEHRTINDSGSAATDLWSADKITSFVATATGTLEHGDLVGLGDDDHSQYHNDTRGDARYYTETELDAGQLDNRYYTETELDAGQLDNRYYTETEADNLLDLKYDKVGGQITGDVTIIGNLTVSGTEFISNVETLEVSDNLILLNAGEVGAGVTLGEAGVEIDRGSETNYRFMFDEVNDHFEVGVSGTEQAVATREDTPIPGGIPKWNDSAYRFDTTGSFTYTDWTTHSGAANPHGTTSADIVHDVAAGETVKQMFDESLNGGVIEQTVITVVSGLSISWTAFEVYDRGNKAVVNVDAGSGSITDNTISYLNWVSGTTATLGTSEATGDEVGIAHFHAQGGVLYSTHYEEELNQRERSMSRALEDILGTIVTSGLIISEYTDPTNALDVQLSAGTYYHEGHSKVTVSGSNSAGNLLYRWYHDGAGDWTYDRNAEIDTTNYDTGTGLAAMSNNHYGKSLFIIGPPDGVYGHTLHWFYPQSTSTSITTVIEGALPSNPAASEHYPHSTALVTKKGDAALPTAGNNQWIDVRPVINANTGAGAISDHGNLTGLTDDDHAQYSLADGSRAYVNPVGGITPTADAHLATKGYVDTVSGTLQADIDEYVGTGKTGQYSIADATDSFTVTLPLTMSGTDYDVVGTLVNTVDATPAKYGWCITDTTTTSFDVELSDTTDSANYKFNWRLGDMFSSLTGEDFATETYVDAADAVLDDKIDTTSGTLQTAIDGAGGISEFAHFEYTTTDIGGYEVTSATSWQTLTLNATTTSGTAITRSSNDISIPAGTYNVAGYCLYDVATTGAIVSVYDSTAGAHLLYGSSCYYGSTDDKGQSIFNGFITVSETSTINLKIRSQGDTDIQIRHGSSAEDNDTYHHYTSISLMKIA